MQSLSDIYLDQKSVKTHKQRLLVHLSIAQGTLDQLFKERETGMRSAGIKFDRAQYDLDDLQQDLGNLCEKIIDLKLHYQIG